MVDLRVAADFAGNLTRHVLDRFPGATLKQQCNSMHRSIVDFYRRTDELNALTPGMLRTGSKKGGQSKPKLRASDGEMRSLIPWLLELAEKTEDSWENTVLQAAHLLWQMYDCLSQNSFCQATFKELTRKFPLLYLALEQSSPEGLWKFKPKFHLLQELAEFDQVLPSLSWTYRDEDWGGSVAAAPKRRGGTNSAHSTSWKNVLMKFRAQNLVPGWPIQR